MIVQNNLINQLQKDPLIEYFLSNKGIGEFDLTGFKFRQVWDDNFIFFDIMIDDVVFATVEIRRVNKDIFIVLTTSVTDYYDRSYFHFGKHATEFASTFDDDQQHFKTFQKKFNGLLFGLPVRWKILKYAGPFSGVKIDLLFLNVPLDK